MKKTIIETASHYVEEYELSMLKIRAHVRKVPVNNKGIMNTIDEAIKNGEIKPYGTNPMPTFDQIVKLLTNGEKHRPTT